MCKYHGNRLVSFEAGLWAVLTSRFRCGSKLVSDKTRPWEQERFFTAEFWLSARTSIYVKCSRHFFLTFILFHTWTMPLKQPMWQKQACRPPRGETAQPCDMKSVIASNSAGRLITKVITIDCSLYSHKWMLKNANQQKNNYIWRKKEEDSSAWIWFFLKMHHLILVSRDGINLLWGASGD